MSDVDWGLERGTPTGCILSKEVSVLRDVLKSQSDTLRTFCWFRDCAISTDSCIQQACDIFRPEPNVACVILQSDLVPAWRMSPF